MRVCCVLIFLLPLLCGSVLLAQATRFVDAKPKVSDAWKGRETRLLDEAGLLPTRPDELTRFGGLKAGASRPSGFFRVEKIGDRWWMIDPEGGLFVFAGMASVKAERGLEQAKAQSFVDGSLQLLREHGFVGCGGFSDHEAIARAAKPMAYTVTLGLMARFGGKLGLTHQESGHMGYADDVIPIFEPGFAQHCEQICREQLAGLANDPWLVGVFSDNELPIKRDSLARLLKSRGAGRARAEAFVKERGPIHDEREREFLHLIYEEYFRISTQAIRAVLPHHLCLGSRFHGPAKSASSVWKAAGAWCDAISMNHYDHWNPQQQQLQQWLQWSGKPCLITEFYVKGMDSGMANTSGAGWVVRTQADRGLFYQNFALGLLESKSCVGWHWFKLSDNNPADRSADPSNRDSNKGVINLRGEPYTALLQAMRQFNQRIHPLIQRLDH